MKEKHLKKLEASNNRSVLIFHWIQQGIIGERGFKRIASFNDTDIKYFISSERNCGREACFVESKNAGLPDCCIGSGEWCYAAEENEYTKKHDCPHWRGAKKTDIVDWEIAIKTST